MGDAQVRGWVSVMEPRACMHHKNTDSMHARVAQTPHMCMLVRMMFIALKCQAVKQLSLCMCDADRQRTTTTITTATTTQPGRHAGMRCACALAPMAATRRGATQLNKHNIGAMQQRF